MALVLKDRVKVTSTTTGTGTLTLAGAATGYQSFAAIGNGNTTYYTITDPATGDWEVGIGTYTSSGTTLSRDTVLDSSTGGSLVAFTAGTKDVFCVYPAEKAVYEDAANKVVQNSFVDLGVTGTATINVATLTSGTVSTTPSSATDIANKQYVDNLVASGVTYHSPVKYEVPNSTGNLTATYNNGIGGVGATLTNAGTQTAFTPDGVVASVNDRVLIYNQTNAYENGVYTVTTVGSGSTNWVLTRATDADSYGLKDPNSLGEGDAFFITSGNTGAGETYICNTQGTITFGTTAINFVQVSSAQIYSAGTGLTLSGTQFSITNTGTAGTYGSATAVPVFTTNAQGQVTSATNTNIAINANQVTAGTLAVERGGTNIGSYTTGDLIYASGTTTLATLADAATGNVLLSGGAGVAPSYGKVVFGTHTSGTLAVSEGGTGVTTLTGLAYGNGTSAFTVATAAEIVAGIGSTFVTNATNATNATTAASCSGNAATATTLQTARNINGVSFNGSADITVTANTTNTLTRGSYLTGANFDGSAATTWAVDADTANTANKVVARDGSGNFAAGTITATLSGNATTATTATTANATAAALTAGSYLTSGGTFNGSTARTFAVDADSANTASKVVARDASGNFSAGTITATLNGNASTATSATSATSATTATTATTANALNTANAYTVNTLTISSTAPRLFFTDTDGYAFSLYNNANVFYLLNNAGGGLLSCDTSGNFTATANVTAYSDERLKKNWRPVQDNFVEKLAQVKSGIYDRTDIEATQAGVSAQDMEKLLKETVQKDDKGILSLAYGNAALVAAIELAKQVVELKKEIELLKAK